MTHDTSGLIGDELWATRLVNWNEVRGMAAMTTAERRAYSGLTKRQEERLLAWAKAHQAELVPNPPVGSRGRLSVTPSAEELLYRLTHLDVFDADYLLERFGPQLYTWIARHNLAGYAPAEWRDHILDLHAETPPNASVAEGERYEDCSAWLLQPVDAAGFVCRITGTDVRLRVESHNERRYANMLLTHITTTRDVHVGLAAELVETRLRIQRERSNLLPGDLKSLSSIVDMENKWNAIVNGLKLPERHADDTWDVFQRFIDAGPQYLAEHGYREVTACPHCGTLVFHWWPVYRQLIRSLQWLREQTLQPWAAECQRILHDVTQHSLFRRQVRDLGMAWSKPLVDGLYALRDRHPTISVTEIEDLVATFFEVSPAALDARDPMSPLNRVKVVDGEEVVVLPDA